MPNWYTINHPTTLHTHNETVTHCCSPMAICAAGCILQAKLPSLDTQPPPGSPRLTILSASSVRTLVHCVVKYSRPPDLKSSSNVSLPFAWITGPATDPSFVYCSTRLTAQLMRNDFGPNSTHFLLLKSSISLIYEILKHHEDSWCLTFFGNTSEDYK